MIVSCSAIRCHSSGVMSTSDRPLPKTNAVSERRVARSSRSESRRYARPPATFRAHAAETVAR
ncbi:MAG: CxxxxCH/CxxCH domain-containing protein [Actinobacteria bacterium]|nr:MAG: CxxxxCH/CxxCH domain-containing protein [Actinomycetota bacterium]